MRFYYIALFLFIFNLVGGYFNTLRSEMGFTETLKTGATEGNLTSAEQGMYNAVSGSEISEEDTIAAALSGATATVVNALTSVFNPLKNFIFWLPAIMINLGVPTGFSYLIGVIFWLIQILGMAQLLLGKSIREVE